VIDENTEFDPVDPAVLITEDPAPPAPTVIG
jgi:hypothetical protein